MFLSLPNDEGFSLLELVISLVLLSFVSIALTSSLHLGVTTWDRMVQAPESQRDIYYAQNALRNFLELARKVSVEGALPNTNIRFSGGPSSLTFIAQMPDQFGFGGDYSITLLAQRHSTDEMDLVLKPSIYAPKVEAQRSSNNETVLLKNVGAVSLRYFGQVREGENPTWSSTWEDRKLLPALVSIDVSFLKDSSRYWPTLLVAPRLNGDLNP